MTRDELIEACRAQQRLTGRADAGITVRVPGRWGRRTHVALWRGGPRGRILSDADGMLTVLCRADEVLAALDDAEDGT